MTIATSKRSGALRLLTLAIAALISTTAAAEFPRVEPAKGVRMQTLAELALKDGRHVQFLSFPDTREIVVGQTAPAGAAEAALDSEAGATPLEMFLRMTPDHVPVPRLLVELEGVFSESKTYASDGASPSIEGLREGPAPTPKYALEERAIADQVALRGVVEQLDAPVLLADATTLFELTQQKAGGGSCGADGMNFFTDNHCGTMGPGGYGVTETDCDAGLSSWIQRTSSATMRHTYTRMASCSTSAVVKHSYAVIGGWHQQFSAEQGSNTVSSWASWKDGIARDRRARFERIGDSGGVRGWTRYFKQLTD